MAVGFGKLRSRTRSTTASSEFETTVTESEEVAVSSSPRTNKRVRLRRFFSRKSARRGCQTMNQSKTRDAGKASYYTLASGAPTPGGAARLVSLERSSSDDVDDRESSFQSCYSDVFDVYSYWGFGAEIALSFAVRVVKRLGLEQYLSSGSGIGGSIRTLKDVEKPQAEGGVTPGADTILSFNENLGRPRSGSFPGRKVPESYAVLLGSTSEISYDLIESHRGNEEWPFLSGDISKHADEEAVQKLAAGLNGHWISDRRRSQNVEPQFKFLGLSFVKRQVLGSIAIPVTLFCEGLQEGCHDRFDTLHMWIHTPLGLRHITWKTDGSCSKDEDPDCGVWQGKVRAVEVELLPAGVKVKALQRINERPGKMCDGITIETRFAVPDKEHGKVLVLHYDTYPRASYDDYETGALHITRVTKFVHKVASVKGSSNIELREAGALKGCELIQT